MSEHILTTYIRTKALYRQRLNKLKNYESVKIYESELNRLGCNRGSLLYSLKDRGEITYDDKGYFKALKDGPIDFKLLEITKKEDKESMPLSSLHLWMREQLLHVELKVDDIPVYFKAFLDHREKDLEAFFTVDAFSNRVHTPIVNLKGNLRFFLKFYGEDISSLDVKQMQPAILARVLLDAIGDNPFSSAIFDEGKDVYMVLLEKNDTLKNRDEAKRFLFKLIFGKPMNEIAGMFKGDDTWVRWINSYKSNYDKKNPHWKKTHTNLAWLLQYSEVQVMTDIWTRLWKMNIPFLTIHDDVLCRKSDRDIVYRIMDEELKKHFKRYNIVIDHGR
jgi:hypothetical protein